ncbi:MAG: TonB-dependent receptor plug domain-containing protein [Candidatus Rokuibacteriota bacterium]
MRLRGGGPGLVLAVIGTAACATGTQVARPNPTGAGIDGRLAPTGAVTSLVEQPASGVVEPLRIDEYLRGRVPGLQVTSDGRGGFRLRLRGANFSLLNGREVQPLVVIDGMPIASDLMNRVLRTLRPSDIRRVDVLRDVASTSVYGMRGASGVILIRTTGG